MGAPKKATHVVVHKKLYFRVEGKLQKMPVGSEIVLSDNEGNDKTKFRKIGDQKAVDLTKDGSEEK